MRPVTPASILAAQLSRIVEQIDAGAEVDPGVAVAIRDAHELAAGLDPYLDRYSTPESPALAELVSLTMAEQWADHRQEGGPHLEQEMLSGHVEGQALKLLLHATRARRVLDVGMFTGYSALAMAEALPEDGSVVACELDEYVAEFAQRCFDKTPDGSKIDVRTGPALRTLETLADDGDVFDLVFIDADKAGYVGYLDVVLERGLLASHGLICVDNTLMQGQPWTSSGLTENGKAIAAFNQAVAADPRVEQVIIPLRDGLTLISQLP
jgi:caffeoyl-CoA O-methyltransferase